VSLDFSEKDQHGDERVAVPFRVSDGGMIAADLHAKDPTGMALHQMAYLSKVEDWVLNVLAKEGKEFEVQVQTRLQRLDDIISNYRNSIPPDNPAFVQILSWLAIDQAMYTVDYLQGHQPDFFIQLLDFCRHNELNDANAALTLKRILVLMRTRLFDRIYSPANVDFVRTTLQAQL
jgi:hypothetical protein